jgi:hypothetical protein
VTLITRNTSLTGGVSQQVSHKRHESQLTLMDNCWPSIVDGLGKRPGTHHIAKLSAVGVPTDVKLHAINRDTEERYLTVSHADGIFVYGVDGTQYDVFDQDGVSAPDFSYASPRYPQYLTAAQAEDLAAAAALYCGYAPAVASANSAGPYGYGSWYTFTDTNFTGLAADDFFTADPSANEVTIWEFDHGLPVGDLVAGDVLCASVYIRFPEVLEDGTNFGFGFMDFSYTSPPSAMSKHWALSATYSAGSLSVAASAISGTETDIEEVSSGVYRIYVERTLSITDLTAGFPELSDTSMFFGIQVPTEDNTPASVELFGLQVVSNRSNLAVGELPPYSSGTYDDISITTVADTTVFANRRVVPDLLGALSEPSGDMNSQMFWVKTYYGDSWYKIKVNVDGEDIWLGSQIEADAEQVGTGRIVQKMVDVHGWSIVEPFGDTDTATWTPTGSPTYTTTANSVNVTAAYNGSVVLITTDNSDYPASIISTSDFSGGNSIEVVNHRVETFTDLPAISLDGHMVHVTGEPGEADDYWVKFVSSSGTTASLTTGYWQEVIAPGRRYQVDGKTMPHILRREFTEAGEIYFTFGPAPWSDGQAGTDDADPWPFYSPGTTVGNPINSVFLFKSRLGFLSGDRVILSSIEDFWQYWRTTTRDLLDGDRVVAAAVHPNVSKLTAATALDERLIVMSDQNQFVVKGDPILTPSTVEVVHTTTFENFGRIAPIGMGNGAYFGIPRGDYFSVLKYLPLSEGFSFDGYDVGQHVPQYCKGPLRILSGSSLTSCLLMVGADRTKIYVYKWYDSGDKSIQSAWGTFSMDHSVYGVSFIQDTAYILGLRDGAMHLESMRLLEYEEPEYPGGYEVHLDHIHTDDFLTKSYSTATGRTTIDFPDEEAFTGDWWVLEGDIQTELSYTYEDNAGVPRLTVYGDKTNTPIIVGKGYSMAFRPSLGALKTSDGVPLLNAQQFISVATISLKDSLQFDVTMYPQHSASSTAEFRGEAQGPLQVGTHLFTGSWRFGVLMDPQRGYIEVTNDSPYPSKFQGIEYEVRANAHGRRI